MSEITRAFANQLARASVTENLNNCNTLMHHSHSWGFPGRMMVGVNVLTTDYTSDRSSCYYNAVRQESGHIRVMRPPYLTDAIFMKKMIGTASFRKKKVLRCLFVSFTSKRFEKISTLDEVFLGNAIHYQSPRKKIFF